jgi:hypothetical protein
MLGIREAFKSAISEFGQRAVFWLELCVLYVLWVNFSGFLRQLDCIGATWFLLILIQLVDFIVYAGLINIAILAGRKQPYAFSDVIVKDSKLWRFLFVAIILAFLAAFLSFALARSTGFTTVLLGLMMALVALLLLMKFSFVPFYILGENIGIVTSIKKSWALADCQVVLSLIFYFLAMIIAALPFSLIDMLLASYHISVVSFLTPLGLLVLSSLYLQAAPKSE